MLRKASELIGYRIQATDGEIGSVSTLLFDDDRWAVRYLVVDTGTWLPGRKVLISPVSVRQASWSTRAFDVALTRDEVKNSPDIDTARPVSRQQELRYYTYYGYPYYWGGGGLWGAGGFPMALSRNSAARDVADARSTQETMDLQNSHLRDMQAVKGYHLHAADGEIGHVDDYLVEDESWAIRYLMVDTSNWLGGRHVLIAPDWVRSISWEESLVHVGMTRDAVRSSPGYVAEGEVRREYEQALHTHYGQTGYWTDRGTGTFDAGIRTGRDRLRRLEDYEDLEVADGNPDPRGWRVVAWDGAVIGTVEHLIVDPDSMKVQYLEVGLEQPSGAAGRGDVLVPLEQAGLDRRREEVRLSSPRSRGGSVTPRDPRLEGEDKH